MPEYAQTLGDVVRSARKSLGLTQSEAADRANIDVRTILNIENYRGNPQMEILYPLIRALKIDPTSIFYPEANRESESVTQFQISLSLCSDEEMRLLLPVCETYYPFLGRGNPFPLSMNSKSRPPAEPVV